MKYGWITANLLDLWSKPRYNSERLSQLLFGEPVKISSTRKGYVKITKPDGYTGWADIRFLEQIKLQDYRILLRSRKAVITAKQASVFNKQGKIIEYPHHLYYGTIVPIKKTKSHYSKIILPGLNDYYINSSNLEIISNTSNSKTDSKLIIRESKRFLGVPYLWGGTTVCGFDCSGLVQKVLARFGVPVPRDTKDQIKIGRKIDRGEIKTGDLIFFKRHVGFAIGKNRLIHSSVGGNGVRINSLKIGMPDYREDLDKDYNQARRLSCIN